MSGIVVIDSNLLVLLVVGTASKTLIPEHKNTKDHFDEYDFELLGLVVADFSEIILVPHIIAETSNLVRQIGDPKRTKVQTVFSQLISVVSELPIPSSLGAEREECLDLGITDAVILNLCSLTIDGVRRTLLTIDSALANRALSQGYNAIDFKLEYQT